MAGSEQLWARHSHVSKRHQVVPARALLCGTHTPSRSPLWSRCGWVCLHQLSLAVLFRRALRHALLLPCAWGLLAAFADSTQSYDACLGAPGGRAGLSPRRPPARVATAPGAWASWSVEAPWRHGARPGRWADVLTALCACGQCTSPHLSVCPALLQAHGKVRLGAHFPELVSPPGPKAALTPR